ncbi:unnamed protein product [Porites evermanni]|uniref:Uncharacterized protein n=1 Tax=Porites evermanni TaxID=104178 RepID=A0ABN8LJH4_9CNID|nr:unnamed protein product [Porites evermanni]
MREIADLINHALLEPLEENRLSNEIPKLPLEDHQLYCALWTQASLMRYRSLRQLLPRWRCSTSGLKGLMETVRLSRHSCLITRKHLIKLTVVS